MPAVTADTLTLPRLPEPSPEESERPVARVTTAPSGFEGEGFPVRRAFAGVPTEELDPFIHMDQMGSVDYGPGEPRGTNWHPHRGFETVTYMLDGTFQHQDSHGGGGVITDGATQWMTAGGGILHIETPPEALVVSGGLLFYAIPVRSYQNVFFRLKMITLACAGLNAFTYHYGVEKRIGEWGSHAKPPRRARMTGALSLVFWATIVICGRMIAYNWFD